MKYLRRYYTGDLITFTSLYEKCRKMPEVGADEDITERLLGTGFVCWVPVRSRMSRFIWNIWNRVKTGC